MQKMVKKQVDLTKYLMQNTMNERVDNILNCYMNTGLQPKNNLDPINHNWVDPSTMSYDTQNILDQMIEEQVKSQIQPTLQSKVRLVVDKKCTDFKANYRTIKANQEKVKLNLAEQFVMAEFDLTQRGLHKSIKENISSKMNGLRIGRRKSSVYETQQPMQKVFLKDKTMESEIDKIIDKHFEQLKPSIDKKVEEIV